MTINDGVDSTALFTGFTIAGNHGERALNLYSDHNMADRINVLGVGGVTIIDAIVPIENSIIRKTFNGNTAGGIIYRRINSLSRKSSIDSNNATGVGGGISIDGDHNEHVYIYNSSVSNNEANGDGGGIYIHHYSKVIKL